MSYQSRLAVSNAVLILVAVFVIRDEIIVFATKPETLQNTSQRDDSVRTDMLTMVASMKGNADASVSRYNSIPDNVSGGPGKKPLKFDWHLQLDHDGRYQLDWATNYADNQIAFALRINQTSSNFHRGSDIFALGFSRDGQLTSSDFCLFWYDLGHQIHLQDTFTDPSGRLKLVDESLSQCELTGLTPREVRRRELVGFEIGSNSRNDFADRPMANDEQIEVTFKRPLDVCLPDRDSPYYTIDNGTTHLVWFALRGPLLSIDGLDLGERLRRLGSGNGEHVVDTKTTPTVPSNGLASADFEFGMKRVQLIAKRAPPAARKLAIETRRGSSHEVRMDNFEIPAKETTYWCKLFKLPQKFESRRYHITRYEAVIGDGPANERIVHHMELFSCANLSLEQELKLKKLHESPSGWSGDCSGSDRPPETKPCKRVILAWAMGAHPLEYPAQVGQSIGGPNYSLYVVLEVHYNNIEATGGILDSSGLRFHYTSRLRPFDAGVLEVGLEYTDKNSIPPNMVAPLAGYCVSECTRAAMSVASASVDPDASKNSEGSRRRKRIRRDVEDVEDPTGPTDGKIASSGGLQSAAPNPNMLRQTTSRQLDNGANGIYIFAAQMHTHLTGVASWTEQVRGGKLLRELQRDNHYSPHFQEIRLLPEPAYLAPGDALIHYCLYDTRKRFNITLGGFATTDEMCVTYLHYYPRIDLEVCKSSVDSAALERYFGYLAEQEAQPTSKQLRERWQPEMEQLHSLNQSGKPVNQDLANGKSVSENYRSIKWSRKRSEELMQFYAEAPLSVQCNRSDGDRLPGFWNGIPATRIWEAGDLQPQGNQVRRPYSQAGNQRPLASDYRGSGWKRRHPACSSSHRRQGWSNSTPTSATSATSVSDK